MKVLYGSLKVFKTDLKNLHFLAGIKTIECDFDTFIAIEKNEEMTEIGMTNFTDTNCGIRIDDTVKLEILNMPNLKNFYISGTPPILPNITIGAVSQSFCVTVQEMSNFMSSNNYEENFYERFCSISDNLYLENQKVCEISNFSVSNFDPSCSLIIGNVKIGNGDESYVYKLKNVSWIFGGISIINTNLEAIDFLDNLEYVVLETYDHEIKVQNNKKLVSAKFPKLKKAREIRFLNNENFVFDKSFCFGPTNGLNVTKLRWIQFENENCETIVEKLLEGNMGPKLSNILSILVFVISVH